MAFLKVRDADTTGKI